MKRVSNNTVKNFLWWLEKKKALDILCSDSPLSNENLNAIANTYMKSGNKSRLNGAKHYLIKAVPVRVTPPKEEKTFRLIETIVRMQKDGAKDEEIKKFLKNAQNGSSKQTGELIRIATRYSDAKYKMVILTDYTDSIISVEGKDLHNMSDYFADIYYPNKKKWNSVAIANALGLDTTVKMPCIAIWGKTIERAKYLDIELLTNEEIFVVTSNLIRILKSKRSIKAAIEETGEVVHEMQELASLRAKDCLTENEKNDAKQRIDILTDRLPLFYPFNLENASYWATLLQTTMSVILFILQFS